MRPNILRRCAGIDLNNKVTIDLQITLNTLPMPNVRMMSSSSCIT